MQSNHFVILSIPFFLSSDGDNFLDLFWNDIPPVGEQQVLDATSLNILSALFPEGKMSPQFGLDVLE